MVLQYVMTVFQMWYGGYSAAYWKRSARTCHKVVQSNRFNSSESSDDAQKDGLTVLSSFRSTKEVFEAT